ncbi:jg13338 [Pararge aegeria aegeria]|uniref:Jg13338 protein n=1 Tax=Pararge aegeria aegeria TaxID=348720 RepID=A0A8S4SKN5_9NEOP|nr:jg13338 [Pararge aegeria aegeria]
MSTGNLTSSYEEPLTKLNKKSHCDGVEPQTDKVQPPDWQRVPTIRNPKRKKLAGTPSPDKIETSNSFSGLTVDITEEQSDEPKLKKPSKPPPIILYGVEELNKLTELLELVTEKSQFCYKTINRNQLKILTYNVDIYKMLISVIRENGLIGHTFNRKDNRCYRIVIRNLHHTTPFHAIKEAIEETGNRNKSPTRA